MKYLLVGLLCISVIWYHDASAQTPNRLWPIGSIDESSWVELGYTQNVDSLKKFIQRRKTRTFFSSCQLLIQLTGDQYRDFILNEAAQYADSSKVKPNGFSTRDSLQLYSSDPAVRARAHTRREIGLISAWIPRYYDYQVLRGYFGDVGAIDGMIWLVDYLSPTTYRTFAISDLVDAGRFDRFVALKEGFALVPQDPLIHKLLGQYGQRAEYKQEVVSLLVPLIAQATTYRSVRYAISALGKVDMQSLVPLLDQKFHGTEGEERSIYFKGLSIVDPNGQPERTRWAVEQEPDPKLRRRYFPTDYRYSTNRYLLPSFILFARQWFAQEPSEDVRGKLSALFLERYRPASLDSTLSVAVQLDSLRGRMASISGSAYRWTGSAAFVSELDGCLASAKSLVSQGQESQAAGEIRQFQQKVAQAYTATDSAVVAPAGATRFVTEDGHRFLWYGAQDILDRLLPPNPETRRRR